MPPVRGPVNAKPLKTERTHEENQERAYIAASRRSDRSLEARIESARRASEIHKKRTGRSLRVTEQDVINEEMYEEEDDDLQSQYRRLQAHLGSSADLFNGRLNSWIMSQYGTRQMVLGGGLHGFNPAMNPQQAMTPFFAYNPQPTSPTGTLSPQVTQRPSFRQSPYPGQQFHRMQNDQRSFSMSMAQDDQMQQGVNGAQLMMHPPQRSHSMVAGTDGQSHPGTPLPQDGSMGPPMQRTASNNQPGHLGHTEFFKDQAQNNFSQFSFNGYPTSMSSFDPASAMQSPISPLTASMPVEAQQIIGMSAFDPSNPYTAMFMNQSHGMPVPQGVNYSYNPNLSSSKVRQPSQADSLTETLSPNPVAPSQPKFDTNAESFNFESGLGLGVDFKSSDSNTAGTPNDMYGDFTDWIADTGEETV